MPFHAFFRLAALAAAAMSLALTLTLFLSLVPADAQTKTVRKPKPVFVWGGFPAPNKGGSAQSRQTLTGVQQITCPPPARPTCGANR